MDDYAGMYCTGDVFPILNAIREQLMAPLPKQHSLRTTDRQTGQVVAIGIAQPQSLKATTRSPSVTTITYPPTHDTFQFIYGSTTTGAPTTFRATAATKRIELQPVLDIIFADRSHYVDGTANNSNMQKQITHSKPLHSKAIVIQPTHKHKQPSGKSQHSIISTIQDEQTRFSDKTSRYPSLSRQPSQPIINTVQTEATRPPKQTTVTVTSSDDKDLRNFLKHAADLPTHRLINGIMKLLSTNGHSSSGAINKIAPHTSSTRTTRKQTTTSITETPIMMHLDAPISRIPDLRLPSRNQIRGLNKSIRPFLHQKLQVSRDVKVNEPFIDRNKHVVSSNLKHVLNGQFNWIDQQRQTNANKIKQTSKSAQPNTLMPPPFPLPSQKEAQPSKSFLDMKDLGFLIN